VSLVREALVSLAAAVQDHAKSHAASLEHRNLSRATP
jgi:hypothetical protein